MASPVVVELKAVAGDFFAKMGAARAEVAKLGTESSSHLQKLSSVGKTALLGLGTAAGTAGFLSVKMADQFEYSHAKLQTAFKNTGHSLADWQTQLNVADKQMEKFGFTNADTQEALANLTTALKSPTKAFDQIGLSADLARYKHIGLAEAATAMARAEEGNLRALKQIGVDLPVASGGAAKLAMAQTALSNAQQHYNQLLELQHAKHKLTLADHIALANAQDRVRQAQQKVNETAHVGTLIQDQLQKLIGGQAAASAATFAGKMATLRAQTEDLAVKVGVALIPILEKAAGYLTRYVIPAFESAAKWIKQNKDWLVPLVGVLGTFIGTLTIASKTVAIMNAALRLMGISTTVALGPIGLIIAAVAALGVGLVIAYKKSETFRDIVQGVFKVLGDTVLTWVQINLEGFKFVLDAFMSMVGGILHGAAAAFGWVPGVGGKLKAARDAFDNLHSDADRAFNGVIGRVESLKRHLDGLGQKHTIPVDIVVHIPKSDISFNSATGSPVHIGKVTAMAKGGFALPGQFAWVGEQGPELVRFGGPATVIPHQQSVGMADSSVRLSGEDILALARSIANEISQRRLSADVTAELRPHPLMRPVLSRIPTTTG